MHVQTRGTRLLALVMAGSLLATACGDDAETDATAGEPPVATAGAGPATE